MKLVNCGLLVTVRPGYKNQEHKYCDDVTQYRKQFSITPTDQNKN